MEKCLKRKIEIEISYSELMDICIELCTVNGKPFQTVDCSALQKLFDKILKGLPGNHRINRKNVREEISARAEKVRKLIKERVREKLMSVKIDSCKCQGRNFFGINIQFVDEQEGQNPKINVFTLAVKEVENNFAINLAAIIKEELAKFDIDLEQVYSVTSDNGANMLKCIIVLKDIEQNGTEESEKDSRISKIESDSGSEYEDSDSEEEREFDPNESLDAGDEEDENDANEFDYVHDHDIIEEVAKELSCIIGIRCMTHTLQLAVNKPLRKIKLIGRVKKICKFLRHSSMRSLLKRFKLKKALISNETRWSSTYVMLKRFLKFEKFCKEMSHTYKALRLSEKDFKQIKEIVTALEPAHIATKRLQKEELSLPDAFREWMKCHLKIKRNGKHEA